MMKKRFQRFDVALHVFLDICAVIGAGFLSERLTTEVGLAEYALSHFEVFWNAFIFIPTLYLFDLYYPLRDFRRYRSVVRLLLAVFVFALAVHAIGGLYTFTGHPPYHSNAQFFSFISLLLGLSYLTRLPLSYLRKRVFVHHAIMIGNTDSARLLLEAVAEQHMRGKNLGFKIVGYLDQNQGGVSLSSLPFLGALEQIASVCTRYRITLMIFALDTFSSPATNELIIHERLRGTPLISALGLYETITGRVPHQHIDAAWLIEECLRSNRFAQVHLKNLFDRLLGGLLLLPSLPVIGVCAVLIKCGSPGPALFRQRRIGRLGEPFTLYKLRTMIPAQEDPTSNMENWHEQQAYRITKLGVFLRRTHLDELPQLFNVVKGDMSLVGPRPEMDLFIRACEHKIPFYRLRLDVKPGITGWAQVAFRHTSSLDAYSEKFEYELYYLSHLSLQFDLEILARTVFIVLFQRSR